MEALPRGIICDKGSLRGRSLYLITPRYPASSRSHQYYLVSFSAPPLGFSQSFSSFSITLHRKPHYLMVNLRAVSSLRGVCCAFQTGYQGITPISLLTKRSQVVIPAASKVVLFSSKRESISRGGIQSTTWEYLPKPYLYQIAGTKGSVTRDLGRRFSSTPSSPGGGGNVEDIAKDPNKESQGKMGKLKYAIRQYGPVAIVTYLGVYVTTLGLLYVAIESGVNPFDYGMGDSGSLLNKVTHTLEGYSWTEPLLEAIEKNPHVGNFALAWILTKFTEPARLLLTLAVVPRIARALGRVPPSV